MTVEVYNGRGFDVETIGAIEYMDEGRGWEPFMVHTVSPERPQWACSIFNIMYCKRNNINYYHQIGGGGELQVCEQAPNNPKVQIWFDDSILAPHVGSFQEVRRVSAEEVRALGYEVLSEPVDLGGGHRNPLESHGAYDALDDETIYCSTCDDDLPCGETWHPCEHIGWCEACAGFVGTSPDCGECEHTPEQRSGEEET